MRKWELKVLVLIVVIVFLGTSFAMAINQTNRNSTSGNPSNKNIKPFVTGNNSSAGYVKYTLILMNNTLVTGNFVNTFYSNVPVAIAFDSINKNMYVVMAALNNLSVINGTMNKVVDNITVGGSPDAVTFDSSNGYMYVINSYTYDYGYTVSIVDGATNSVIGSIEVIGSIPDAVAFDSSNNYVYVSNEGSGILSVINVTTNDVVDTISVSSPDAVTFDSSNGYMYVLSSSTYSGKDVSIIDGTNNTIINAITVGSVPDAVAFDSSNGYVYVANYNSDNVSVINGATNSVIGTIPVGTGPDAVAFDSSNGYVYVANYNSDNVSVINGATNSVIGTIPVGTGPDAVAFDSSNGYVYVANYNSGTISIVSTSPQVSIKNYSVTFTETGLPSGTTWYVNLTNGQSFSSTTSTISFSEPNGTYSYTIATTDKTYSPSPYSSSFTVNGASVPVSIAFSKVQYTVKFTESGLPSGTTWYVNLTNGQSFSSTTSTISFSEPNGTYSYTIGSVSGYTASPSSGSLTVSGSNATKTITFTVTSTSSKPSGISSTELYGIIGAVVAVAIIGTALAIMRKRK
jgi:YVTN family beta-propeller protein